MVEVAFSSIGDVSGMVQWYKIGLHEAESVLRFEVRWMLQSVYWIEIEMIEFEFEID